MSLTLENIGVVYGENTPFRHTALENISIAFPKGKVTSSRKVPTLLLFWERKAATTNPTPAPVNPEEPALAWGKAKGLLTDSNLEKPVTRAELVRVLYKLKGE